MNFAPFSGTSRFAPFTTASRLPSIARFVAMARTIRGRLWIGSLVVVSLLIVAGVVACRTLGTRSREMTTTLRDEQTESRPGSQASAGAGEVRIAGAPACTVTATGSGQVYCGAAKK